MREQSKLVPKYVENQLYRAAGTALSNKRYRQAIDLYEKFRVKFALTVNQKYRLAMLYDHSAMMGERRLAKNDFDLYLRRALSLYREIIKEDPSYFHALYGIGRVHVIKGHHTKGLRLQERAYRQMMKLPRRQRGALGVGSTYEKLGDFKKAERWYLREYNDAPRGDFGTAFNLFKFYERCGDRQKILEYGLLVERLIDREFRKKAYRGLKMQSSAFVRSIRRDIGKLKRGFPRS